MAALAVIGLEEDTSLWGSVDSLQEHLVKPDRVVPLSWQRVCSVLAADPDGATSLAGFGSDFTDRYLDLSQVPAPHG